SYYVDRYNTGSPQTSQLMYHTLVNGSWTHSVVTSTPDGYVAGDGAKFTGFAPQLYFDSSGRANIVFSDEAGEHLPVSFANEFAGPRGAPVAPVSVAPAVKPGPLPEVPGAKAASPPAPGTVPPPKGIASGWAVALDNGAYASQVFVFRYDRSLAQTITPYGLG